MKADDKKETWGAAKLLTVDSCLMIAGLFLVIVLLLTLAFYLITSLSEYL